MAFDELWFVVKSIHLRTGSGTEDDQHFLRFGRMMRVPCPKGFSGINDGADWTFGSQQIVLLKKGRQCDSG